MSEQRDRMPRGNDVPRHLPGVHASLHRRGAAGEDNQCVGTGEPLRRESQADAWRGQVTDGSVSGLRPPLLVLSVRGRPPLDGEGRVARLSKVES
jgi:hypothetical protein